MYNVMIENIQLNKIKEKFPVIEEKQIRFNKLTSEQSLMNSDVFQEIRKIRAITCRGYNVCKIVWLRSKTIEEAVKIIHKYI